MQSGCPHKWMGLSLTLTLPGFDCGSIANSCESLRRKPIPHFATLVAPSPHSLRCCASYKDQQSHNTSGARVGTVVLQKTAEIRTLRSKQHTFQHNLFFRQPGKNQATSSQAANPKALRSVPAPVANFPRGGTSLCTFSQRLP